MRYRALGHSDLKLPVLIFGCGNFGGIGSAAHLFGQGDSPDTAHRLLDQALAAGITMFDTANTYGGGRSETWLGEWLSTRGVRDEVMITTKVGNPVGPGPQERGLSAAHLRAQVDRSLCRLKTDRIDLYLTHTVDPDVPLEETVTVFGELIQDGKIRAYGVSDTDGTYLDAVARTAGRLGLTPPVNLQGEYNLLNRSAETGSLGPCGEHAAGFTAFSPLAGGLLTGKYRAGDLPTGSRGALMPGWYESVGNEQTFQTLERLRRAAAERGIPLATLALAWVISHPEVSGALIAPRTQEQLDLMLAALEHPLDAADRATLSPG